MRSGACIGWASANSRDSPGSPCSFGPENVVLKIVMRCYYPEEFEQLITDHGFNIPQRWGGYSGEVYGEGSELVIEFQKGS